MPPLTAAHVTHEACEKIGGIGTVLEGILTSPIYQQHIRRSILVGPLFNHLGVAPGERLGGDSTVLYSGIDGIDEIGLSSRLHPIEWAFNVNCVYGRRRFIVPQGAARAPRTGEAEILLVDVFNINRERLAKFKGRLWQMLGIDSRRYENDWGYEEYVRLAEPAFYALCALLRPEELPCVLFAHEFMGLPTAFKATLEGQHQFRTIFHAHECSTARDLVEHHPGHDTRFYAVLRHARAEQTYVEDVFGDRSHLFRHALVRESHVCDAIVAVGQHTAQELHFLDRHFDHHHIDLVHNGIPAHEVTIDERLAARAMLAQYAENLIALPAPRTGPDVLMTHVTRPVVSKGIWRDLQVCHELEARLAVQQRHGVLFMLTSAGGTRRVQDVRGMEDEYGWPRRHRVGYPDLVGPEIAINDMVEAFNAGHAHVQVVLVNQFGWSKERLGDRVPDGMTFEHLRCGTDVEFGLATYEPFGISPLEPLGCGAICLISTVCGCKGFVDEVTSGKPIDNVLVADYIDLRYPGSPNREDSRVGDSGNPSIDELLRIGHAERDAIEKHVAVEIADKLMRCLPREDGGRARLLEAGQSLVAKLGWDDVLRHHLIPVMHRIVGSAPGAGLATHREPLAAAP